MVAEEIAGSEIISSTIADPVFALCVALQPFSGAKTRRGV